MKVMLIILLLLSCYAGIFSMESAATHETTIKNISPELIVIIASFLTIEEGATKTVSAIKSFGSTDKYLYAILADPVTVKKLIRAIAHKFLERPLRIEALFLTETAKKWLAATLKKYKKASADNKELMMADCIATGATEILAYLFDHGVNINGYAKRYPPLVMAAFYNKPKVADFLLHRGADIDQVDIHERTPLFHITRLAETEKSLFFELLAAHKPDLSHLDEDYRSPLTHAVMKDDVALVKLLVAHGACIKQKIKLQNKLTTTALDIALHKMRTTSAPNGLAIFTFLNCSLC